VTGATEHVNVTGARGRTGVLVVRAWLEGSPPGQLRARITQTLDISAPREVVRVVGSADDVLALVRAWLDALRGNDVTMS
jgi:hypothetical protein